MSDETALINRTLYLLGATGAGQTASAEDSEMVRAAIQGKLDDLSEREVVSIDDSTNFEARYLNYLALCLANDLAPAYGKPIDVASVNYAEDRLKKLSAARLSDAPVKAVYY